MGKKYVYNFSEGNKDQKLLLGGKGAGLAEMTNLGINVPFGFTISTEACTRFTEEGKLWPELLDEIQEQLALVEKHIGKKFGDEKDPLLFSVRSGAPISMPGMMDTILNLGLNDKSAQALAESSNNPHWAYDSYRRFIKMFADVAQGFDTEPYEEVLTKKREAAGVEQDYELSADDLKDVARQYKELYLQQAGEEFPQDPEKQLHIAIEAVFKSWNNDRAVLYRRMNEIPDSLGTAVNVQQMVFGNLNDNSGTGVAFSRNPATGENKVFGEYLMNAQGEDVVAGIRTPETIAHLEKEMPAVYEEFVKTAKKLEEHYQDMQDMEFTIQDGQLYLLQTRNGKRTGQAAVKVAVDIVHEGLISKEHALTLVDPMALDQLLHPRFNEDALKKATPFVKGLAASPGAASGKIAFSADEAAERHENGETVILVRTDTSPDDLKGMASAAGILTSRGGMTSHAAVVARGMGKCCVSGAKELIVNAAAKQVTVGDLKLGPDDTISVDGSTGNVYAGSLKMEAPEISGDFEEFMGWADSTRRLGIRTNADNPRDAQQAIDFGAEGIGLCRTEHMFFSGDRIKSVREMILSDSLEEREKALEQIRPMQEEDFYEMFKICEGKPMTIRLLDPPLHEFMPKTEKDVEDVAKDMGLTAEEVQQRASDLVEVNPMMGHRGLRLCVTNPEIYRMQARAIVDAALRVNDEQSDYVVEPHIMIPLSMDVKELSYVKNEIVDEINKVFEETGKKVEYTLGTMIEIPRATLVADEIARNVDFFSFGTNDLTQMTFGFSRDDAERFIHVYIDKGILEQDPFVSIDQHGVGQLVEHASKLGREANPDLELGVCGEHGGDPESVKFFNKVGVDYVSCSPFRVPIARLAAAQAVVEQK